MKIYVGYLTNRFWTNGSFEWPLNIPDVAKFTYIPAVQIYWDGIGKSGILYYMKRLPKRMNYCYIEQDNKRTYYFIEKLTVETENMKTINYQLIYDVKVNNQANFVGIRGTLSTTSNIKTIEDNIQLANPVLANPAELKYYSDTTLTKELTLNSINGKYIYMKNEDLNAESLKWNIEWSFVEDLFTVDIIKVYDYFNSLLGLLKHKVSGTNTYKGYSRLSVKKDSWKHTVFVRLMEFLSTKKFLASSNGRLRNSFLSRQKNVYVISSKDKFFLAQSLLENTYIDIKLSNLKEIMWLDEVSSFYRLKDANRTITSLDSLGKTPYKDLETYDFWKKIYVDIESIKKESWSTPQSFKNLSGGDRLIWHGNRWNSDGKKEMIPDFADKTFYKDIDYMEFYKINNMQIDNKVQNEDIYNLLPILAITDRTIALYYKPKRYFDYHWMYIKDPEYGYFSQFTYYSNNVEDLVNALSFNSIVNEKDRKWEIDPSSWYKKKYNSNPFLDTFLFQYYYNTLITYNPQGSKESGYRIQWPELDDPNQIFLFDLVGTDFYCLIKGDVTELIVKEDENGEYPLIKSTPKQTPTFQPLTIFDGQDGIIKMVNQKVDFNLYYHKFPLTYKFKKELDDLKIELFPPNPKTFSSREEEDHYMLKLSTPYDIYNQVVGVMKAKVDIIMMEGVSIADFADIQRSHFHAVQQKNIEINAQREQNRLQWIGLNRSTEDLNRQLDRHTSGWGYFKSYVHPGVSGLGNIAQSVASGATAGAFAGSAFGGVGALPAAVIGGAIGLINGIYQSVVGATGSGIEHSRKQEDLEIAQRRNLEDISNLARQNATTLNTIEAKFQIDREKRIAQLNKLSNSHNTPPITERRIFDVFRDINQINSNIFLTVAVPSEEQTRELKKYYSDFGYNITLPDYTTTELDQQHNHITQFEKIDRTSLLKIDCPIDREFIYNLLLNGIKFKELA